MIIDVYLRSLTMLVTNFKSCKVPQGCILGSIPIGNIHTADIRIHPETVLLTQFYF